MPEPLRLARPPGRRGYQRVDIEGGGVGPPLDRDPITGPLGVLLCVDGAGGGVVVGLGADVGCGWLGAVVFDAEDPAEDDGCESLMAPPLGRSSDDVPPCASGSPLGRSVSLVLAALGPEETAALFVSGPGG